MVLLFKCSAAEKARRIPAGPFLFRRLRAAPFLPPVCSPQSEVVDMRRFFSYSGLSFQWYGQFSPYIVGFGKPLIRQLLF